LNYTPNSSGKFFGRKRNACRKAIVGNNTIDRISLDAGAFREDMRNTSSDDVRLETVLASLAANSSIQDATLVNFRVLKAQALSGFLMNCRMPKVTLKLLCMSSSHHVGCFCGRMQSSRITYSISTQKSWGDVVLGLDHPAG
jgi:hypothetical protein